MSTQTPWHEGHPEHGNKQQEQKQEQKTGPEQVLFNEHQKSIRKELHAAASAAIKKCGNGNDIAATLQVLSELLGSLLFTIAENKHRDDIGEMIESTSQGIELVSKTVAWRISELMAKKLVETKFGGEE